MNLEHERDLEQWADRQLKALPDLTAPATLPSRVMRALALRSAPWHRRPWQLWPTSFRAVSLAAMLGLFAGLCVLTRGLAMGPLGTGVTGLFRSVVIDAEVAWKTVNTLAHAFFLAVTNLSPGILIAWAAIAAFSYCACVGLGTLAYRFAFSKRQHHSL